MDIGPTWSLFEEAYQRGDKQGALFVLLGLAKLGEWVAFVEIGNIYEFGGGGVNRDIEKAIFWYQKAIFAADDPSAHFSLGRLYYNGKDVDRDYSKAATHLTKALSTPEPVGLDKARSAAAYVMLGTMHEKGWGVSRDIDQARKTFLEGCQAGLVWPMLALSALELRQWRVIRWFALRYRAARLIQEIISRDPNDPRLAGVTKWGKDL